MRLIWVNMINRVLDQYTGGKRRPISFDVAKTYPALQEVTRGFADIRQELDRVLPHKDAIPRYHEIDQAQKYISSEINADRAWRTYMLISVSHRNETYASQCPRTSALLAKVPNVVNAFFSILDPEKSIPAHNGGYRGILRYHLGLVVPQDDPPHIRVGNEIHQWREGEAYFFDDTWEHEVTNHSRGMRVVLAVDVLRPLPFLPQGLNRLAIWWMSRSNQYKKVNDAIEAAAQKMQS